MEWYGRKLKGDQGSHQTKLKVEFHESISLGQSQWIHTAPLAGLSA